MNDPNPTFGLALPAATGFGIGILVAALLWFRVGG